jgi:hypothetical protein
MVIGNKIKLMVMELINGLMEDNMKVNGITEFYKERVYSNGKMEDNT